MPDLPRPGPVDRRERGVPPEQPSAFDSTGASMSNVVDRNSKRCVQPTIVDV
jgi:hypothetical protein